MDPDLKHIYEPDNNDFLKWIESDDKWPASDWDYYVIGSGENDALVFQYADNSNCPQQDFCVHCLYYLVGEYFNSTAHKAERLGRINTLLSCVSESSTDELKQWQQKTSALLSGQLAFEPQFWFNYMFLD